MLSEEKGLSGVSTINPSWVSEIISAFRALGGAARYDDLYEYIQRTTARTLTAAWKATVRRTIEDHSSDSANFRADDLFRHLDHGFWALRDAGDLSLLVKQRRVQNPRAVVEEALRSGPEPEPSPQLVFVREHWRQWPMKQKFQGSSFVVDPSLIGIADGWVTDQHLVLKLAGGLILNVPLNWYPILLAASRSELLQIEIGAQGVYWQALEYELLVPDILAAIGLIVPVDKDQ